MQVLKIQTYLYDKMHHTKIFKKYFTFLTCSQFCETLLLVGPKRKNPFFLMGSKNLRLGKHFLNSFSKQKKPITIMCELLDILI